MNNHSHASIEANVDDLRQLDADGALEEALDAVGGISRAGFLTRSATVAAGVGGLALLHASTASAASPEQDTAILNYALTLEYLETAFYVEALKMGALTGRHLRFATIVAAHEQAHVDALKGVLGSKAVARPWFDFQGTTEAIDTFTATSIVLEDTGVAAYKGQAGKIQAEAVLTAALAIHAVEARHAGWIRQIAGEEPAPEAFDKPLSMRAVLKAVGDTKFIVTAPSTGSTTAPPFTG